MIVLEGIRNKKLFLVLSCSKTMLHDVVLDFIFVIDLNRLCNVIVRCAEPECQWSVCRV
jgi:hypothetical protein